MRLLLSAAALALALSGCDVVGDRVGQEVEARAPGVVKAADCAALARDTATARLDGRGDATSAQAAADRLRERAEGIDDAELRSAAERLAAQVDALRAALATGAADEVRDAAARAREAATAAAAECGIPLEQFL